MPDRDDGLGTLQRLVQQPRNLATAAEKARQPGATVPWHWQSESVSARRLTPRPPSLLPSYNLP